MENVQIKKAKIKDLIHMEVEYNVRLEGHAKNNQKLSSTVPIHADLKAAFDKLTPHLAVMVAVKKPRGGWDLESEDEFTKFECKGFVYAGADSEGVMLIGNQEGLYGVTNLNTPIQKFETSDYPFLHELQEVLELCLYEVEQYIFHNKRAPEQQLELDMEPTLDSEFEGD